MRNFIRIASAVGAAGALALASGCNLGGGSSGSNGSGSSTMPPPPATFNYTAFVKRTLKRSGTSAPRSVNNLNFVFDDLDNPDAYDDVIPPSGNGS